ncbi:MAG: DUF1573 domain-containing protein [Thermoguttaceae bacterium]|nr:DUF1573 domain-containing protein [Thermoguttaceae bacterium]
MGVAVVVLLSAVFTAQLWQRKDDRIVVSSAQNNTEIRGTNARRRVVFEHDFGVLAPKVERRHSFTVANATDIDWKIKRMEVPCACTIARITNTIIKAGSAETVELTYRSGTASADERRTVSLVFEEDDAPIVQLALRAQVRTPLALSRDRVTFNSLGQGCRATEVVYVRNYSSTDWTALSLNSSVPWLRLSCRLLDSRSGGLGEPRQEWLASPW